MALNLIKKDESRSVVSIKLDEQESVSYTHLRIVANEYGIQLRNSPQYTAERLKDIHPDTLNERGLDNTCLLYTSGL